MSRPETFRGSARQSSRDDRFQDRVAIVTGAAGGIGAATARAFAAAGAEVVGIDIKPPAPSASDPGVSFILGDIADPDVYERAISLRGRVDVLFANAAISGVDASAAELEPEEWARVLDVNLTGTFVGARAALRAMISQGDGGAIVITSSVIAIRTEPGSAAYAASKAGLLGMTRALAVEGASDGVRVNAVLPGAIDTPMARSAADNDPDANAALQTYVEKTPMSRLGRPDEIAAAVLFLASAEASFVTGTSLAVDGGLLAHI